MQIRLYIFILLCLRSADYLAAQAWTKEDSVWLRNILSGKDTLRLNPETMRAIQSGTLINNTHEPVSEMQLAPNQTLPILKDFLGIHPLGFYDAPQGCAQRPASGRVLALWSPAASENDCLPKYAGCVETKSFLPRLEWRIGLF